MCLVSIWIHSFYCNSGPATWIIIQPESDLTQFSKFFFFPQRLYPQAMSSYFVNSLFTKFKGSDSLRSNYYECSGYAQDLGSRPSVLYGHNAGSAFQHAAQFTDFYHHGTPSFSHASYQQNPCAVPYPGEATGNLLGQDGLQRQSFFGSPDADFTQFGDCNLKVNGLRDDLESAEPCAAQLFPWMRPQGETRE